MLDFHIKAEIFADRVRQNLKLLRGLIPTTCKLCCAAKADCYGHGVNLLLDVLTESTDMLAVATASESQQLRDLGYAGELLVFSPVGVFFRNCEYLAELIVQDIQLTVTSVEELQLLSEVTTKLSKPCRIHLKLDTGMGRSGIATSQAQHLLHTAMQTPQVELAGIYSHLATADSDDKTHARLQFKSFHQFLNQNRMTTPILRHIANSAATIDLPEMHLDMVRPGIAVYGYQPSDQMHKHLPLQPAMRVTAPLMEVKTVAKGTYCGYGLTHQFDRPSRIGLVPIGYGDGYLRCLSNQACMKVGQAFAPIRGRVSMDKTIIDLTDIPHARLGDEVEIVSADPSAPNSVENLARLANTIPYEITCRLQGRIRKVRVDSAGRYETKACTPESTRSDQTN